MEALPPSEISKVREGLLSVARGCRGLFPAAATPQSLAGLAMKRGESLAVHTGSHVGQGLFASTDFVARSVAEHIAVFVDGVKHGTMTVSLAAVTRAALEGAANLFYVLSGNDADAILRRHARLTVDELKYPVRHSQFTTIEGISIEGADLVTAYAAALEELGKGVPGDALPSMSDRVTNLLANMGPRDPAIYSQLSGVAHAAPTALGMFIDPAHEGFVLDRRIVSEYVGYLYVAGLTLGQSVTDRFGTHGAQRDRWVAACSRASNSISDFRDGLD